MKSIKSRFLNRKIFFLYFGAIVFISCTNERYQTAISMKNSLCDSLEVITFQKKKPIEKSFLILKDQFTVIYDVNDRNHNALELMNNVFDSIIIKDVSSSLIIKFKPDGSFNYKTNPYKNMDGWSITSSFKSEQNTFERNLYSNTNFILDINDNNLTIE